jgi:hypothetical protein
MTQVTIDVPGNAFGDSEHTATRPLGPSKTTPIRAADVELFGPSTSVVALTKDIHIVAGQSGTLKSFEAVICGAIATGADRTISVDLQKSTGAGAFATVLTAPIGFTNVSVLRTAVAAALASASLVDGDVLRVVVTVAGAAGAQATGLLVTLTYSETYA